MTLTKPTAQRWGEAIRKARTDLRLSILELATRVGMDPGHLSRVERGLAGIGDEYRIALADALGVRANDLFTYDSETPCPPAASATDAAASPTPATAGETRSPARSAKAQAASAREGSHGNE